MEWLNYHHLQYFWVTAREGGVSRASEKLRLSQPTISAQIKKLEEVLNVKLFQRHGRSLVLTEVGRMVFQYADQIFNVGRELLDAIHTSQPGRSLPLTIGVSNAVPKLVACRLLRPLMHTPSPIRLVCREDGTIFRLGRLEPEPPRLQCERKPVRAQLVAFELFGAQQLSEVALPLALQECLPLAICGRADSQRLVAQRFAEVLVIPQQAVEENGFFGRHKGMAQRDGPIGIERLRTEEAQGLISRLGFKLAQLVALRGSQ